MKIGIKDLRIKILNILAEQFATAEAECVADYILWAEMSDIRTQGLLKLAGDEPLQKIKPLHPIKIERDTKLSQVINAGAYPAPIVSQLATDVVIKKAREHGFAIAAVHNFFSSNGAQAYYAEKIAKDDLIGICCSRSPSSTTGFDSIDPLFGTNPIGFGFPTSEDPLVFDMATSAMTFYGLILARARGESIPPNMAINKMGEITRDPEEARTGALLPFDRSYKSSGLAMVVEILAGPLASSAWIDNKTFQEEWGALFLAIDPALLVDVQEFKNNCSDLISEIKNSRKKEGYEEIRLPGERRRAAFLKAAQSGFLDVDEAVLREIEANN